MLIKPVLLSYRWNR